MNVKLLGVSKLKRRLGSSESTLVKMPNCWKSHDTDHLIYKNKNLDFFYILVSLYFSQFAMNMLY